MANTGATAITLAILMSSQAIGRDEVDVSCMDSEIHACVKGLQKVGLSFPIATVDQQLADNSRTDVSGKTVPSDMSVHLTVTYPSSASTRMLDIHYRAGFVVDSVTIQLQADPSVAKTSLSTIRQDCSPLLQASWERDVDSTGPRFTDSLKTKPRGR